MSDQKALRRRIAMLEELQEQRINVIAQQEVMMRELVELKQRQIDNLKTQLTIGVAR